MTDDSTDVVDATKVRLAHICIALTNKDVDGALDAWDTCTTVAELNLTIGAVVFVISEKVKKSTPPGFFAGPPELGGGGPEMTAGEKIVMQAIAALANGDGQTSRTLLSQLASYPNDEQVDAALGATALLAQFLTSEPELIVRSVS